MSETVIKPFVSPTPPNQKVLFENFGVTFCYAQMLENELKLLLTMAELQGIISIDRKKDLRIKNTDEFLADACMGGLKEVLKKNFGDEEVNKIFDGANAARRLLAHRFFIEHARNFSIEKGIRAANQHLQELYFSIRQACEISVKLSKEIFSRGGFTPEMLE